VGASIIKTTVEKKRVKTPKRKILRCPGRGKVKEPPRVIGLKSAAGF